MSAADRPAEHVVRRSATATAADSARAYLALTRLLDDVERDHPEISGPLRLTLVRAHRDDRIGWLDERRFREVVSDLVGHTRAAGRLPEAG